MPSNVHQCPTGERVFPDEWEICDDDSDTGSVVSIPGCLPQRDSLGRRRCKDDGKLYCFKELVRAYSDEYSLSDLADYWRDCCRPLEEERAAMVRDAYNADMRERHYKAWRAGAGRGTYRLVSLGGWCGPKIAFRTLELDGPSLPWDWSRSSLDHVMRMLRTDFHGFLTVEQRLESRWAAEGSCHPHGVLFTTDGHVFWHHDLFDPRDLAVLERRVQRFCDLSGPLLFVRTMNTTLELRYVHTLLNLLQVRFGDDIRLLFLVDWQRTSQAIFFRTAEAFIVHTVQEGCVPRGQHTALAYREPIQSALAYAETGTRPTGHAMLNDPSELLTANDFLRHVSLGENLTDPMFYEPVQPPVQDFDLYDHADQVILREQMEHAWSLQSRC